MGGGVPGRGSDDFSAWGNGAWIEAMCALPGDGPLRSGCPGPAYRVGYLGSTEYPPIYITFDAMKIRVAAALVILGFASVANSREYHCEVGLAQAERGNADEAIAAFDLCLTDPSIRGEVRADYMVFRGSLLLMRQSKPREAIRDFEEVIRLREKPNIYDFFWLADAQAQLKLFREARATLAAAAEVVPRLDPTRGKTLRDRIEFLAKKYEAAEASTNAK